MSNQRFNSSCRTRPHRWLWVLSLWLVAGCAALYGLDDLSVGPTTTTGASVGGSGAGGETVGGGGGNVGGASVAICTDVCDITDELDCANEAQCHSYCQTWFDGFPWCQSVVEPWMACGAEQTAEHWYCDNQGNAALDGGVCQALAAAGLACMYGGPDGGLPDMSSYCEQSCNNTSHLACVDEADCVQECANLVASVSCGGAFAAVILCFSQLEQNQFHCEQNTPLSNNALCGLQETISALCLAAGGG